MVVESTPDKTDQQISDTDALKEALKTYESWYNRILDYLKTEIIVYHLDVNRVITYVSPSVENILGYTPAEFLKPIDQHWTSAGLNEDAKEKIKLSLQGVRQLPYRMEMYHQDGTCRLLEVNEIPVFNIHGEVERVEGILRDIEEKNKADEKLEQTRNHYESWIKKAKIEIKHLRKQFFDIVDFYLDPTYVVDDDRKIIAWNRAMEKVSGFQKKEVLGQKFRSFMTQFYKDDKPFLIDLLGIDLKTIKIKGDEIKEENGVLMVDRYLPKLNSGAGGHVRITAGSIADSDGKRVGAVESVRNIGEVYSVESKSRKNEKRLSEVMNNLPGMAYRIIKDGTWKMEFVSQGCRLLTGYESSFFEDQNLSKFFELIHEDDLERVEKEFQAAIDTKRNFNAEYRILTASGETRWVFNQAQGATIDYEGTIRIEGIITDFTAYKQMEQRLRNENLLLRSTMRDRYKFGNIIGNSKVMQDVYELILKAATTNDSVFISGESGTGKELVSQAIHNASNRANHKCVTVNCGAIPENLIESEFFGYQKGAFTGANTDKKGFLEVADGGTLFLDEIGEISLNMQVKLLRAIEGGGFSPIGSRRVIRPNLRIIAASNKNPIDLVKQGKMRSDFYFRIHVIPIHLPPLRDRDDDIYLLIDFFLKTYSNEEKRVTLTQDELKTLKNYHWPGNVRELQNVIRRYIALRNLDFLNHGNLLKDVDQNFGEAGELEENTSLSEAVSRFEKKYIMEMLKKYRWQKGKTADILNISRKTLFRKMKRYDII